MDMEAIIQQTKQASKIVRQCKCRKLECGTIWKLIESKRYS